MADDAQESAARRKRRGRRRWAGTAVFLLVLAGLPLAVHLKSSWPDAASGIDAALLYYERGWRRHFSSFNGTLPGAPDPSTLDQRLTAKGFKLGDAILIRIFKREFELEVWLRNGDRYRLFETYPICRFSGELGPKLKQGDRQAPEGFYTVAKGQLNPASRWHRSFNLGFPNVLDRAHGRTGTYLMVHGGCSSAGCYAMTNPVIDEIWRLVSASLDGRQRRFQVQAFPFRMNEANLDARADRTWAPFWRDLKAGSDLFEATGLPPRVQVCNGRYAFGEGIAGAVSASPIVAGCALSAAGAGVQSMEQESGGAVPAPVRSTVR